MLEGRAGGYNYDVLPKGKKFPTLASMNGKSPDQMIAVVNTVMLCSSDTELLCWRVVPGGMWDTNMIAMGFAKTECLEKCPHGLIFVAAFIYRYA